MCTSQVSATLVQVLGYSTKAQTQLGLCFVPFLGLSSSGDQVLDEHTLLVGRCVLSPPCPSRSVFWVYNGRAFSDVLCVSSGEPISGWMVDVDGPESQGVLVSNEACLQFGK